MKKLVLLLCLPLFVFSQESEYPYKWPMYNDIELDLKIENPSYETNEGPLIMFDSAHKNFFVQSHLIKPLVEFYKR